VADAYTDALRLLAGRELSVSRCRARLLDRDHDPADVDQAIERLLEDGSLNDARVARAYARTAVTVKGRGRLRVARELHEMGIARDVAAAALAEVYGELDERSLVTRAMQKKLRGRPQPSTPADFARIYQHLLRQGFSPSAASAEVRRLRRPASDDDE
jgi:regulatory protein